MYHLTAHLRMNAIYWGLTALCIMGHQDALDREEMITFVMSCWDEEAGLFPPPSVLLQLTGSPRPAQGGLGRTQITTLTYYPH